MIKRTRNEYENLQNYFNDLEAKNNTLTVNEDH